MVRSTLCAWTVDPSVPIPRRSETRVRASTLFIRSPLVCAAVLCAVVGLQSTVCRQSVPSTIRFLRSIALSHGPDSRGPCSSDPYSRGLIPPICRLRQEKVCMRFIVCFHQIDELHSWSDEPEIGSPAPEVAGDCG